MIKKICFLMLVMSIASYAFMGPTHSEIVSTAQEHMLKAGYIKESAVLRNHYGLLKRAVQSPDYDYPKLKVPPNMVPPWMKQFSNKSIGKWEHVLPNDVPKEIDKLLKKIAPHFDINFRYADEAITDWFNIAVDFWKNGEQDSAMFHIGRACHLIQDICVPMHCRVTGNLKDVWDVLNHEQPNHTKFENHCIKVYKPLEVEFDLKDKFKIPETPRQIAGKSRKLLKYCDGFGSGGIFNYFPLRIIFPWFVEDYDKAAKISTQRAEEYTTKLIHLFFQTVNLK